MGADVSNEISAVTSVSIQMDLKHIHSSENLVEIGMNLKDYYPSGEWDILDVPAERHARIYECCPDEFYAGTVYIYSVLFVLLAG